MENFTTKKESTKIEKKKKYSAQCLYFLFSQKGHQKLSLFLLFDKWPKMSAWDLFSSIQSE